MFNTGDQLDAAEAVANQVAACSADSSSSVSLSEDDWVINER